MTVYARSDIAAVSISPAHGGCGQSHSRPAPGGDPVPIWGLTCHGGCEDVLRADSMWSSTHTTIPETPDEVLHREDMERRGALEQQESTAKALMELAKLGTLPEVLATMLKHTMTGGQLERAPIVQLCMNGHQNQEDARFCYQCGANMSEGVKTDRGKALTPAESPVDVIKGVPTPEDESVPEDNLESLPIGTLRAMVKERGHSTAGTKNTLIALLRS